ncbi:MAG: tetratricopeptide repeat protein, partial [Nannocystaceae bacterium]|nr:tetratricopeptide repeat protein [Nannocystaceae bacterium]
HSTSRRQRQMCIRDRPSPDEAGAVELGRQLLSRARVLLSAGRYPDAGRTTAEARIQLEPVSFAPVRAELAFTESAHHRFEGRFPEAVERLRRALSHATRARRFDLMADTMMDLVFTLGTRMQRYDEIRPYRDLIEGMVEPGTLRDAKYRRLLGMVLRSDGQLDEAELQLRSALKTLREVQGEDSLNLAPVEEALAGVLYMRGDFEESLVLSRGALEVGVRERGDDHPDVAASRTNVAATLAALGRHKEAEVALRRAISTWEETAGPGYFGIGLARHTLASSLVEQGDLEGGISEQRKALEIHTRAVGEQHSDTLQLRTALAQMEFQRGNPAQAERMIRDVLEIQTKKLGVDDIAVAQTRHELAGFLFARGALADARLLAEQVWARAQVEPGSEQLTASSGFLLVQTLWNEPSAHGRARAIARQAYEVARSEQLDELAELETWLRDHGALESGGDPGTRHAG